MTARSEVGIDLIARDMASREVAAVGGALRGVGTESETTGRKFGVLGSIVHSVGQGVFLGVGVLAVQKLQQQIMAVPNAVIGMNASLEKSTLQFETLFHDADRAREHVRMLFEFAKVTPFETQPVINASRLLQTFGGDALNTEKYLRMVGDAAAGASTDIGDVAFWVGRAYAAIQGGQPFGEARMRLQELALLTPEAAAKMEELQKAGAKTSEVWAIMQGELNRFSGAMEKQATTWEGLSSTLSDVFNLTLADAFKPFFDMAKEGLTTLIALLSDPAIQEGLRNFAEQAVAAFRAFLGAIATVFPYFIAVVRIAWDGLQTFIGIVQSVVGFIDRFKVGITILVGVIAGLLIPTLIAWAAAQIAALAPWIVAAVIIGGFVALLVIVIDTIAQVIGAFLGWLGTLDPVKAALDILGQAVKVVGDALGWVVDRVKDVLHFFGLMKDEAPETANTMSTAFEVSEAKIAASHNRIVGTPAAVAEGLKPGASVVGAAADTALTQPIIAAMQAAQTGAKEVAKATPGAIAQSLREGRESVNSAGSFLKQAFEDAISPTKEIAYLQGQLTGKELKKALNSTNPEIKAAGEAYKAAIEERLWALKNGVPALALATGQSYADALAQKKKEVADAAAAHTRAVSIALKLEKESYQWGDNTGDAYARGLGAGLDNAIKIGQTKLDIIEKMLSSHSPPGPESPLHEIDIWGEKTGRAWSEGLVSSLADAGGMIREALRSIGDRMATPLTRPPALLATAGVPGLGASAGLVVNQTFNFGRDSVRSDDDIRRIGIAMQERAQLQGFAATAREVGRVIS